MKRIKITIQPAATSQTNNAINAGHKINKALNFNAVYIAADLVCKAQHSASNNLN